MIKLLLLIPEKVQPLTFIKKNKKNITEVDFIKIDTQGSELDILEGSLDFLSRTVGIEVEMEFVEVYKGQPLFDEVNSFLTRNGFNLFDI